MVVRHALAEPAGERLAALVERAGRGALEWMTCIAEMHDAFDADATVLYAPPHLGRPFVPFVLHRLDLSRIASKLRDYSTKTPFLDRAIEFGLAPGTFFDRDVVPAGFIGGQHHSEVLDPIDWADGLQLVLRLPSAADGGVVLKLWRFRPKPHFEPRARELAEYLFPFLQRATEGKFKTPPPPPRQGVADALDGLSTAVFVFAATGKPVYLNAAARRMLDTEDTLASSQGKVTPIDQKAAQRFLRAIERAATENAQGLEVVIPRADGRPPVMAVVSAVANSGRREFSADAAAIAYVVDTEMNNGHALQARRAQILFDLTDAECEILRLLLDDLAIGEIAARRASAIATVRTQIKAILQKTRSRRRQDLLRFRRLAV